MLQKIRNAINAGKTSGEVQSVDITYLIEAVPADNLQPPRAGSRNTDPVLLSSFVTEQMYRNTISSAIQEWVYLFNTLYGSYVTVSKLEIQDSFSGDASADIIFGSANISDPLTGASPTRNESTTINTNLTIGWAIYSPGYSIETHGTNLLFNRFIYD